MANPDPVLAEINAHFGRFEVTKTRGGYTLLDPRTGDRIARLKPIPDSDRLELFYWSLPRERWRTFGPFGTMPLTMDEIKHIIDNEPIFRTRHPSLITSIITSLIRHIFR